MMTGFAAGSGISVENWSGLDRRRSRSSNHHSCYVDRMRTMKIRPFPGPKIQITDLGFLIKERLIQNRVIWPDQAPTLVGYMAWPNDSAMRQRWLEAHGRDDQSTIKELTLGLKIIQQHWARVADIVHLHQDLAQGGRQRRRGGPSLSKSISLIAANAKSKGTGTAKLWEIWKAYKNAAHLATAAVLVAAEAQTRHRSAPYGLSLHQFQPYRMAMLLPELVISVAMSVEKHGLQHVAHGQTEPMFDRESLWRIPADINLTPLAPPVRKMTRTDLAVLHERRAGNRGKANRRKTTPVPMRSRGDGR
jgi:hypothetical protein